jgi:hypothetical protein
MKDQELDQIIKDVSPIGSEQVDALDLRGAELELMEEIMATDVVKPTVRRQEPRRPLGRRPLLAFAGLVAATATAVLGALAINSTSTGPKVGSAFAASAVRVAEANPRLLLDAPGWRVSRADEFAVNDGEMTFSNGSKTLDVHWRPADLYQQYLDDRHDAGPASPIPLLGQSGTLFHYLGAGADYATILPPTTKTFVEIRGNLGSKAAYLAALRSLKATDVNTWLSALPPAVVRPVDRAALVQQMLKGIPVPEGYSASSLESGDTVANRESLAFSVAESVSCAWFDEFRAAKAVGDNSQADAAFGALRTVRHWPVVVKTDPSGTWAETITQFFPDMRAGTLKPGSDNPYRFGYSDALWCDRF